MKVRSWPPMLKRCRQRFTFIWKRLNKVGRKVSIFVLTIRNQSLYSGKITTFLNIERMSLKLLTTLPKKIIEMQIISSEVDGIKIQLWEAITRYRTRISGNGLRGRIEMGLLLWKPFCVKKVPSFKWWYCMSVNLILSTGQGQIQVAKGHYDQNPHLYLLSIVWRIVLYGPF